MADAGIDIQASNLFSLSANFKTQSSTTGDVITAITVQDELGNVSCEANINDIINYTQTASYCGADFVGDLGTFLTEFGNVQGSKCVTGITINMTASEYCTIDIEGHNHLINPHEDSLDLGYADVSGFLPNAVSESFAGWDGFGVPDFGITVGSDASPVGATVTFSMNHIDQMAEDGDHLVGKNITPRCELSMDFSGVPTSNTDVLLETDFVTNNVSPFMYIPKVDSTDTSDSNSDFDSFAFVAHANTDLATV